MEDAAKTNRMIGILGGMGPEATLDLYREIIELTPASRDQDHIRVLIYSNPKIPERTKSIVGKGESPLAALIESAKLLEQSGAGIIAMPCNTAHYFLRQMQPHLSVPILDMIEETCRKVREILPDAATVGLIAAIGTVRSGLYHRALADNGFGIVVPSEDDQRKIQEGIVQVKAGSADRQTQEMFQSIGISLAKAGADAVILGCTELPLAFDPREVEYPCINSTRVLAEAAVNWALGNRR